MIKIATNMSPGEDIEFVTTLTSYMQLGVEMDNKPLESVTVVLFLDEVDGLEARAEVEAAHTGRVEVPTVGMPYEGVDSEIVLSIHDVVTLFSLDDTTRWRIESHGTFLGWHSPA